MANEIRLRANNISGSITDNPLLIGATTINSPGFVDLPTVDTTNHLIIILDPLEVNGQAEIVRVTAHGAAASSLTVVRGAESTTPRQHPLGTTWFHGPVATDFVPFLATSGARPAVPYTGEKILETDTLRNMVYTGTVWQQDGLYWDPPACRVFHSVDQAYADSTASVASAFNSERYDTDNMHSTVSNNSRITFNTAGVYNLTGSGVFAANATGSRFIAIRLNGATFISAQANATPGGGFGGHLCVSIMHKFAATDYVELMFATAGAALNLQATAQFSPEFAATWIGRGN